MQVNSFVKAVFFDLGDTLIVSGQGWVAGAEGVLAELRASNIRLGLISNTGTLTRAQLTPLLPPNFHFALFEAALVILSSEVKVEKPKPEIFRKAIKASGLQPGECLFCGEDFEETLVAQAVGMRAARVQRPASSDVGSLAAKLKAAGLLAP